MTKISRGSTILLCAILGIALLIGAVCNFAYSPYSTEPVEAAETYASASSYYYASSYGGRYLHVYVYYDNTYINSARVTGVSYANGVAEDWQWTGTFTLTPNSGTIWRSGSTYFSCRYGYSNQYYDTAAQARTAAYNKATSSRSFTRDGNTFTYSSGFDIGYRYDYEEKTRYYALVVKITLSASNFYYQASANVSGNSSNGSVDKTSATVSIGSSTALTFVYTSTGNGYFNIITIDGISATISASEPADFTSITPCQYKCWRSDNNKITVIVQNLTKGFTITGTVHSITPSITGGSDSTAILTTNTSNGYPQWQYTFTARTNYYINSVNIGGTAITNIPESDPGSFSSNANCDYKCYRSGNNVIVIINVLKNNTNVTGTYSSLWSVTSNKASIVIQEDETLMNRTNYFVKEALIVAEFSRNQNLCIIFDGVTARLKGDYSTGTISLPSGGEAKYTFNIYNNFVAISLTFPNGPHTVALDYYVGIANNINTSFDAGHSGNVEIFIDSAGVYNLVVTPNGDDYVNSLTFDNVMVDITYYKAEIYGVGAAKTVTYVVKDNTNVFLLQLDTLYDDINVTFNLSSLKPDYEVPPAIVGGGNVGVSGTVVSAGLGGEARIVGTDSSSESGESVTVMAVAYSGFRFVGWVNANDETEILSNSTSATFDKDAVDGMVLKALFEPTNSNNSGNSNSSLDDPINGADIL